MHVARATQYLLNLADKMPEGGGALRIAVEGLVDAGDKDALVIMALGARVESMEKACAEFNQKLGTHPG